MSKIDNAMRDDNAHMARALQLAEQGLMSAAPNPRVGCVLVKDGVVIAEGWHIVTGGAHAEIHALQQAKEHARGATAYVTLEPCSHHGRTAPCCDALINAGIVRMVYGMQDPNPLVAGRGLQKLREAGIVVDGAVLEVQSRALNPGFVKRMQQNLPFVRLKMAMSLDGRTAMASGESQWITGEHARRDVQCLRARSCAIVTGSGTALHDNAALTVREPALVEALGARRPLRVLLDTAARLPISADIFSAAAPTLWCTGSAAPTHLPSTLQYWQAPLTEGRIDLRALLTELAHRHVNEVLVEAGATLAGAFLQAKLVDEIMVYIAPKLLGSAARPLFMLPFEQMAQTMDVEVVDIRAVGKDWRVTARPVYSPI